MRPAKIRRALKDLLDEKIAKPCQVYAYPSDKVTAPCIVVRASDDTDTYVDVWGTFGDSGLCELALVLDVLVPYVDDEQAFEAIDEYLSIGDSSTQSILDAVEGDTLGDTVQYVHVLRFGKPAPRVDDAGVRYLGVEVPIVVVVGKVVT